MARRGARGKRGGSYNEGGAGGEKTPRVASVGQGQGNRLLAARIPQHILLPDTPGGSNVAISLACYTPPIYVSTTPPVGTYSQQIN